MSTPSLSPPPDRKWQPQALKAQEIKRARNPYDLWPDLLRYAQEGFDAIPLEDRNARFRWWGLYTQSDGQGIPKGSAEAVTAPYFMLRIKIPGGHLTAAQLRTIAELAREFTRGFGDITTRQDIQLHWVRIEDVPTILTRLNAAGITTLGACGDVTRNVVGCPLGGVDRDELIDPQPLVREVTDMLLGNRDFYDLPRKFKICITGCPVWCPYPEINDIGFTPTVHPESGQVGFSVRVGGGLSTTPHLAVKLNAWVPPAQVATVTRGITEIFRDSEVLRTHRERARMKFLFLREGWTAETFQQELERRLGGPLAPAVPERVPASEFRDHVGVHPQKQAGLNYLGLNVFAGRLTAEQMSLVAEVAERYGDGTVRTTVMQNLVILNVPDARVEEARAALRDSALQLDANAFRRGTIACTGTEFCKLAITETKALSKQIANHLAVTIPDFDGEVKIHVTGCPNSCGQHWIADLGLQGGRDRGEEAYDFFIGGGLGQDAGIARRIGVKLPTHATKLGAERLVRAFRRHRRAGESFKDWSARHSDEELAVFTLLGALDETALHGMMTTYQRWKLERESVSQFLCRYGMVGG